MADEHEIEGNDLSAVIANEISLARDYDTSELAAKRSNAIFYLRGIMPDVPPRPNGSSQTSRDFSDAVWWTLPSLLKVFAAADQMVEYAKVADENDDWSRDASEYTNYTFFRESKGYRVLFNAIYDALTLGDGVVSAYWEPPRIEKKTFRDKTPMELVALMQEEGWKPVKNAEPKPGKPRMVETDDGEEEVKTLTVKLQKEVSPGKICDIACKPDNLRLNSTATTIENARFVDYEHDDKTRSDLMEMADDYGWDKEVIGNLPSFGTSTNEVQDARTSNRNVRPESPFKSGDPIPLHECYLKADKDGDGIAEVIQAWWAGDAGSGALLGDEEWDEDIPYTIIPCFPVAHSATSEGFYDRTVDGMQTKTVLIRQALDNLYASNLPQREVDEGSVLNPDSLVNPKFGGIIWKKAGSQPIQPHTIPFAADKVLTVLTYMDEQLTKRTGVSRQSMALDPQVLTNQTATANANALATSNSQVEFIARNMAELGWTDYFAKRLRLAIKHQKIRSIPSKRGDPLPPKQMPMQPRMAGPPMMGAPQIPPGGPPAGMPMNPGGAVQPRGMPAGAPPLPPPAAKPELSPFRKVDPSKWNRNMAVSINVGLGTGSRDRDMAMLNLILNGQIGMADKLAEMGLKEKAIEFIPKIRNTAVRLAESSGLKNPEDFYPEFTDEEVAKAKQIAAQPPEPPEMKIEAMKGQIQGQLAQAEGQITLKVEAGKDQLATKQAEITSAAQVRREAAQLEADMATKDKDRANAVSIERERQMGAARLKAMDTEVAREKLAQEWDLEVMKLNAATVEEEGQPGPDGKPKPKTKRRVVDQTAAMLDAFNKLGQRVDQLTAYAAAPAKIYIDPVTGEKSARKVMN